jgi:hypothetical protein
MRIDQINSVVGFPEKVKNVPPNYPTVPGPGKISLLWQYNKENLWHRFSPYTQGDNIFGVFPNKQPFIYRYPDAAQNSAFNRLPTIAKTLASAVNIPEVIDDTVRVAKFTVSPQGILYNAKQFGLQRMNLFDETRMYNPLSPILAVVQSATLGLGDHPRRHIEGNILTGIVNSLASSIGISFESGFATPQSTTDYGKSTTDTATSVLSKEAIGQAKGLIRGGGAKSATTKFDLKWKGGAVPSLGLQGLFESIKGTFQSYFGGAPSQSGTKYRGDDASYKIMRDSKGKLDYYDKYGSVVALTVKYYPNALYKKDASGTSTIQTIVPLHTEYSTSRRKYESKFDDTQSERIAQVNTALQKVLDRFNPKLSVTYTAETDINSKLMSFPKNTPDFMGYNSIDPIKNNALLEYDRVRNTPRTVDRSVSPTNTIRMATSFTSDALNQIGVIGKDKKFAASKEYPNYTEYKPYEDDLIAFFFYDVVNQKYIPFRATVKGISEGGTAFWDELRFIGRADQLYSYNGFSRTLSFTFNIVISSLIELLPTWKKVNYMASAVKPSNYTTGAKFGDNRYSRFIVPPMFMLTIGDMYKFQPIVITSINVNIPDDAAWETLTELNSEKWSYLNGIIRSPNIGKKYAQFPREAEIAISCNLLEKERAVVGGSHFGHAPTSDTDSNIFVTGNEPYLPNVTQFDAAIVTTEG